MSKPKAKNGGSMPSFFIAETTAHPVVTQKKDA